MPVGLVRLALFLVLLLAIALLLGLALLGCLLLFRLGLLLRARLLLGLRLLGASLLLRFVLCLLTGLALVFYYGDAYTGWLALLGPQGMPKPIVESLYKALQEAVNDPAVRSRFVEQGAEPTSPGPEELQKFIVSETAKWRDIITKAGIEPN